MVAISTIAHFAAYKTRLDILFGQYGTDDRHFFTLRFTAKGTALIDYFQSIIGDFVPPMLTGQCCSAEKDEHTYMITCVLEAFHQIRRLQDGQVMLPLMFPTPRFPSHDYLNHNEASFEPYVKQLFGWTPRYGCRADGTTTSPSFPVHGFRLGGGERAQFFRFQDHAIVVIVDKLDFKNVVTSITQGSGTAVALCESIGATRMWVFGHATRVIIPVFLEKCGTQWFAYAGAEVPGLGNAGEIVAFLMLAMLYPKGHATLVEMVPEPSYAFVATETRLDAPDESGPSESSVSSWSPETDSSSES